MTAEGDFLHQTCRDIVEEVADGVRILDADGRITYANDAFCRLTGYAASELVGRPLRELFPEDQHDGVRERLAETRAADRSRHEVVFTDRNGHRRDLEIRSVPIHDDAGNFQGSYAVVLDITQRKRLEAALREERDFLDGMIRLCPDSIIGVDRGGTIILFNEAAEGLTGWDRSEVIGRMSITRIYHPPEMAREVKRRLHSSAFGGVGRLNEMETHIHHRDGHPIPVRLSATLLLREGEETGSVGFFHDMTVRKQMEARLRELSVTDSLSGLFNQRHFYTLLEDEVKRAVRYARPLSLICFDLDGFKPVNDRLGHLEGDNIIRAVGAVLTETLRRSDPAFRYGGDEFMALLPETGGESARETAERIRERFAARMAEKAIFRSHGLRPVSLSVGVAELGAGEHRDMLVKRADLAMYEAKGAGGDRVVAAGERIGR
jgi:diguanylate cyclase (GGDEF)-like protein/PAS domain S-box-containing protein